MIYLLLLLGFVLLIKGADWLVSGATAIASRFGVSDLIIGLTIVSMGTSLPELIISVIASLNGSSELATGNVLGSNIANILLILGVTAILCDLPVHRNTILSELPFSLAAALLVGFLANASLGYDPTGELLISRIDGIIILFFFLLFMVYILVIAREDQKQKNAEAPAVSTPMGKSALRIAAGIGGQRHWVQYFQSVVDTGRQRGHSPLAVQRSVQCRHPRSHRFHVYDFSGADYRQAPDDKTDRRGRVCPGIRSVFGVCDLARITAFYSLIQLNIAHWSLYIVHFKIQ